jgi:hypothetical protein
MAFILEVYDNFGVERPPKFFMTFFDYSTGTRHPEMKEMGQLG